MRISGDLALIDDTVFVIVQKLNRVFNRQDVVVALDIYLIDHRCKRCRFTGTGRTGDENQATRLLTHV